MELKDYRRIILVGSAGSGKSWLSKQIAHITGYPLIHLDKEYWQPDWVETPKEEWKEKQKGIISWDRWIIDGNYGSTMEMRFFAAELVIFLDISRVICVWRAARRAGKKRSDLPEYLEEPKFNKEFFAFLRWIWNFPVGGREKILSLHEKYPEKPFLHIKSTREVKRILKKWVEEDKNK